MLILIKENYACSILDIVVRELNFTQKPYPKQTIFRYIFSASSKNSILWVQKSADIVYSSSRCWICIDRMNENGNLSREAG